MAPKHSLGAFNPHDADLGRSPNAYRQCRSLIKGLDLIAAMNQIENESATITELADATGIHRTTVKRLLETLRDQGYVEYDLSRGQYRLSHKITRLSHGFTQRDSLARIAWPFMLSLSKRILWPCTLSSFEGDRMKIRRSTQPYSLLSFHPGTPGRELPMLFTAAGKAYLANVSDDERSTLLEVLAQQGLWDMGDDRAPEELDAMLRKVRESGYSINDGDWSIERKFAAFAVPLMHDGRVLLCLSTTFLRSTLGSESECSKIANALQETREHIEQEFSGSAIATRLF